MLRTLLCVVAVVVVTNAAAWDCVNTLRSGGLSKNFNETVAHAIHSMTVQGLQMFIPSASAINNIPTVNHDLRGVKLVRSFAPDDPLGDSFGTHTMNVIDKILTNLGQPTDGLGPNWSPIERVVHNFHMWDLWTMIQKEYKEMNGNAISRDVCACLLDTKANGIFKAVRWVADHYKVGTPITLLNREIPKLTNAESWKVWKERLLHYYNQQALTDAATYLHCVARNME